MTRSQLEHLIRASGGVSDSTEIVIVGSQSILGQFPDAPGELCLSMEADVYPKDDPEKSIVIDGAIGEGSIFEQTFGYYAHGVSPETATLPEGASERMIAVRNENTHFVTGWCLEVHDLAASKLAAGREKDIQFVRDLFKHNLVQQSTLLERVGTIIIRSKVLLAQERLEGLIARIERA